MKRLEPQVAAKGLVEKKGKLGVLLFGRRSKSFILPGDLAAEHPLTQLKKF